jgi:ABC-type nitrate/sulfonate/bicarbonate transport system substrate-binding protein
MTHARGIRYPKLSRRWIALLAMLLLMACNPAAGPAPTSAPAQAQPVVTTAPAKPAEAKPAAAASPVSPAQAKPTNLRKVKVTQAVVGLGQVHIYVGRAKGFFAEQGLDVEQISTGGGGPDVQALISGDAEFNVGAGSYQADALRQGQKMIAIYNLLDKPIVNVAMHADVAREKGITEQSPLKDKLAALKGLTIGATRPGALTFQQAEYMVRAAGLKPQEDVKIVGAGEGAALIAALETRQVDVFLVSMPVPEQAVARGKAIMLINNAKGEDPGLVPFNQVNLYVRSDTVDKDPEMIQQFVNGVRAADAWIANTSPAEITAAIKADFTGIDEDVMVAAMDSAKGAINRTGLLDKKAVENTLTMQGQTVSVDDVYALFTDRFVRAAR